MIFPSIDLMNHKVVQLVQGKKEQKKIEIDNALEQAQKFSNYTIQVIDLDAAMGNGNNLAIIKELCSKFTCRVGGGIRTLKKAEEIIKAGAKKIIIGSAAFKLLNPKDSKGFEKSKIFQNDGKINTEFLKKLKEKLGKEKIIIAIDSKKGKIVIKGWKESTDINAADVIKELEPYCSEFLYTYVDKEGMMQGTDFETLKKLKELTNNGITAAGGISSEEEIKKLEELGINSVLGMALYTGKIKLT